MIEITLAGRRFELTRAEAERMHMMLTYVDPTQGEVGLVWCGAHLPMTVAEALQARDLLALALRNELPS